MDLSDILCQDKTRSVAERFEIYRRTGDNEMSTVSYINAGIKSKKEAAERLIKGEIFYCRNGLKIYFNEKHTNPFRYETDVLGGFRNGENKTLLT